MPPEKKKRSKAFYKKMAFGGKKYSDDKTHNVLLPGIRGFLVTCNSDERGAVRETYNILNEYADSLYGPDKNAGLYQHPNAADGNASEEEEDDVEKALQKEVAQLIKASSAPERRFQNVMTKAKNCVFIRTSLENPCEVTTRIMEDIAEKHLKKARHAARILPTLGTCRANPKDIEKLATEVLQPLFCKENPNAPKSYTVLYKMRNNNGTACGRDSVIPAVIRSVKDINPDIKLTWTENDVAIVIEVVCTVCCLCLAPDYFRLRKYNLQELQQGARDNKITTSAAATCESESSGTCDSSSTNNNALAGTEENKDAGSNNTCSVSDDALTKDAGKISNELKESVPTVPSAMDVDSSAATIGTISTDCCTNTNQCIDLENQPLTTDNVQTENEIEISEQQTHNQNVDVKEEIDEERNQIQADLQSSSSSSSSGVMPDNGIATDLVKDEVKKEREVDCSNDIDSTTITMNKTD